ncbi:MAG: ASCH domain-containing protein [Planctomycetota bacterium]
MTEGADVVGVDIITRALSIRQPYAEQILRSVKTAEFRSRPTKVLGEAFLIYAARTPGPTEEFARIGVEPGSLPTGVIVGVATVTHCSETADGWAWHLTDVRRLRQELLPERHPQPTWWHPFDKPVRVREPVAA